LRRDINSKLNITNSKKVPKNWLLLKNQLCFVRFLILVKKWDKTPYKNKIKTQKMGDQHRFVTLLIAKSYLISYCLILISNRKRFKTLLLFLLLMTELEA
jgi:hypothetical protein